MRLALDPQMFHSTHSVHELPNVVARMGYSWMEFSHTLTELAWSNARLAPRPPEDEVKALKAAPGRDIFVIRQPSRYRRSEPWRSIPISSSDCASRWVEDLGIPSSALGVSCP